MEVKINPDQHYDLQRLKIYLNYELSTSILYFLHYLGVFIVIFLALAAALIFTPFMLIVLFKENKIGWIIFFIILVILPLIIFTTVAIMFKFGQPLPLIPLGLFYFYCFLLRYEVNGWLREINAKNQYQIEKRKKEAELKDFMDKLK